MTPDQLVVLVPVLGRAHTLAPLLDSVDEATPGARVLFLATATDTAVLAELDRLGREPLLCPPRERGDYAAKINAGVAATSEPLIFLGACDLRFHPGWYELATQHLDHAIRVIGTNDLANPRTARGHSTHCLLTRDYADRGTFDDPGKVLHEGYWHEWVDDEFVGTARHRRAYRHRPDVIVEHLHPMAGKAPMDPLYARQGERMRHSRPLHRRRSRAWT